MLGAICHGDALTPCRPWPVAQIRNVFPKAGRASESMGRALRLGAAACFGIYTSVGIAGLLLSKGDAAANVLLYLPPGSATAMFTKLAFCICMVRAGCACAAYMTLFCVVVSAQGMAVASCR
jgi:hypothetical protein